MVAELPLTVQLVSVAVPLPLLHRPPPLPVAELPLMVQLVSVAVPRRLYRPPPLSVGGVAADGAVGQRGRAAVVAQAAAVRAAELPLTVQLVSVAVPPRCSQAAAVPEAELPLTVQLVSVAVPALLHRQAAAVAAGGVAAEGAVGQRGRADSWPGRRRRRQLVAELPLTVQLVSVAVPPMLYRPPPSRDCRRSCR